MLRWNLLLGPVGCGVTSRRASCTGMVDGATDNAPLGSIWVDCTKGSHVLWFVDITSMIIFQFMLPDCIIKQYPLMFKLGFRLGLGIKEVYLEI
jgi:hypothetical protein